MQVIEHDCLVSSIRVLSAGFSHQEFMLIFEQFPESSEIDVLYSHEPNCLPAIAMRQSFQDKPELIMLAISQLLISVFDEIKRRPGILIQGFVRFQSLEKERMWSSQQPLLDYKIIG